MKVGIIGDVHLGVNENKPEFVDYQIKCIQHIHDEFRKLNIKQIIYLGDIFDKRQSISVKSLKLCQEIFDNEFEQFFILGNHDTVHKNTNDLSSVQILLGDDNIVYTDLPEELILGDKVFLMTPWINKTNSEESNRIIDESKAHYLMGHLDINGFEMIRGFVSKSSSVSMKSLNNFDHVISGHYHCFSNKGNITYLGNICEMTWNDFEVDKFAGYMDTSNGQFHTIDIPLTIHKKIRIQSDDDCVDVDSYAGKIVKCYLYTSRNIKIEKFITDIIDVALSVSIIDEQVLIGTDNIEIDDANISTTDLWKKYLDEVEIAGDDGDKEMINDIFIDAYKNVSMGDVE